MLKILKNLKKSFFSCLIIITLLCIQAMADLSLPDYTSKIINIGIQQSGIQEESPEVMRYSKMQDILVLSNNDNEIISNYKLINKDELSKEEYTDIVKKYPKLNEESLYIRNEISTDEKDKLEETIKMPLAFLNNEQTLSKSKELIIENVPEEQKKVFNEMSIIDIIKMMPEEQKENVINSINEKLSQMPESIISQSAIAEIKSEYESVRNRHK